YVPVVYFILAYENTHNIYFGGFIFVGTPAIWLFCRIFSVIWLFGVGFFLIRYTVDVWNTRRAYKYAIFCDGWEYDFFEEICKELNIKAGKVELVQDIHEEIPKIVGVIKPMIVLPVKEYTKAELRVIFIHELTHYKQKDLWLIYLSELAKCFHFCNYFVWKFADKVQYWGEYACDYDSVHRIGELKSYFEVIATMVTDKDDRGMLSAHLVEKKEDLVDRMERMKRSYKMKNKSKLKAGLLVAAMMIMSTCSVSAATITAGRGYVKAYFSTAEQNNEEAIAALALAKATTSDEFVEYEEAGFADGVNVEVGEVNRTRSVIGFEWTIGRNSAKKSDDFQDSTGNHITVTVDADSSVSYRAGIIEPDGTLRYVNSNNGYASHQFELDQTGTYSVYVQNMTSGTITVKGSYIY
ncbi:MAG: M56 family metallopeptidase, partial [Clostridiales bacterium]|nr:M56 family metallopeptidase [Clostridiales bacterium]